MTLSITSIANAGELDRERIVLRANKDLNLTNYAIFCCHRGSKSIRSGDVPYVYWFNSAEIKSGDLIVLYTKKGVESTKKLSDQRTSHFFYWALGQPIWVGERSAVSVNTASWNVAEIPPEA